MFDPSAPAPHTKGAARATAPNTDASTAATVAIEPVEAVNARAGAADLTGPDGDEDPTEQKGPPGGLAALCQLCFGKRLDKDQQLSNWRRRPLRENQLIYAALDAYCLVGIADFAAERLREQLRLNGANSASVSSNEVNAQAADRLGLVSVDAAPSSTSACASAHPLAVLEHFAVDMIVPTTKTTIVATTTATSVVPFDHKP